MPLLLYCVADSSALLNTKTGVAGSPVARVEHAGLALFYSESSSADVWLKAPLRKSAQEFHRIQQQLFNSGAIVPFRFPTILELESKLREHLSERSAAYKDLLERFASVVQMDIVITHSSSATALSGAEYLRERQSRTRVLEKLAGLFRNAADPVMKDWRQRTASNGLRCFGLVERKRVKEFNEKLTAVSVPEQLSVRVSGPWPVAEFIDLQT